MAERDPADLSHSERIAKLEQLEKVYHEIVYQMHRLHAERRCLQRVQLQARLEKLTKGEEHFYPESDPIRN